MNKLLWVASSRSYRSLLWRSLLRRDLLSAGAVCLLHVAMAGTLLGQSEEAGLPQETASIDKPVEMVAGRSLADFAGELNHDDRTTRLQAIRSLAPFGTPAAVHFATCLDHEDPAMRYLAAVGLGDLGMSSAEDSIDQLKKIASDDSMQSVRMSACYALCQAGQMDDYLPKLGKYIDYPERGMACCAALLIGKLGAEAKSIAPVLQAAYDANAPGGSGDYHVGGAAKNALRKLGVIQ